MKRTTSFTLDIGALRKLDKKVLELRKKHGFKVSKTAALQMMIEQFKV